jgi:hypothetical protein
MSSQLPGCGGQDDEVEVTEQKQVEVCSPLKVASEVLFDSSEDYHSMQPSGKLDSLWRPY